MKFFTTLFAFTGVIATAAAVPSQLFAHGKTDLDKHYKDVEVLIDAAVALCADIDVDADIDLRADVFAKVKAEVDVAVAIIADLTAEITAKVKAEVELDNEGCDEACIGKKTVDHSKKVCEGLDKIEKKLGKDVCGEYTKTVVIVIGRLAVCLNKLFIGIAARVNAVVKVVLSLDLSVLLDIDLDLGGVIGGIIGRRV